MKFLNGLSPSTSVRLALIAMLAFASLLTGCGTSYASTTTEILHPAKSSPPALSNLSKDLTISAGPASDRDKLSTAPSDRFTSSTGSEISRHSATDLRSVYDSAGPIELRSNLSEISIISISRSSEITPANRFGDSSLNDISKTVLLSSDANHRTSSQTFELPPAKSLRTSPTDKPERSFKPQFSGSATGRTSALLPRRRSNWRGSSQRSTPVPRIYARHWTESWSASAWHRQRSSVSISLNRANLPRNFTNRT